MDEQLVSGVAVELVRNQDLTLTKNNDVSCILYAYIIFYYNAMHTLLYPLFIVSE